MSKLNPAFAIRALLAGSAVMACSTLVLAQVEQLPETDRSEAVVDQLNRRIGNHEQIRDAEQQQQFESNQLQTRWQTAPSPIRPRAIGPVRP